MDEQHDIKWIWVKGHADNELNNLADELAVAAMAPFK
jgi:ribonuclease HI